MVYKLWIIGFMLITMNLNAQSSIDNKYLQAILYLKIDKSTNKLIKHTFRNEFDEKEKFIKFNILNRIEYLKIGRFRDKLRKNNHGISTDLIYNPQLYDSIYYFEPYTIPLLDNVLSKNNSKIYLTFSKPINNYVVAEIMYNHYQNPYDQSTNIYFKSGTHISFIFFFDSNGMIKDVVKRVGHY